MTRTANGHGEDDDAAAAIQAIDDMGEVELGTVRLINGSDAGPRSWDPKRGEHRQHISTVLGEAFYSSQRRKNKIYECLAEHPHPVCNFAAIGLAGVCLLLIVLYAAVGRGSHGISFQSQALYSDDLISPEGLVHSNFGLTHDYRGRARQVQASQGMVAADHGRCSDIGKEVLEQGGNAVDAAVATALCQGVLNPQASGLGGGCIMMIKDKDAVEVVDAREVAPRLATPDMFKEDEQASIFGGKAVAVPLELKGLSEAHARYGSMAMSKLVAPAAELARNGFPAHPYLINALSNPQTRDRLLERPDFRDIFYKRTWFSWRPPTLNETCCARPALADLLDDFAKHGPPALYQTRAQELASEIQAAGGIITAADLSETEPTFRTPLKIKVWGLTVYAPPPPSAAATLLTALQILAGYEVPLSFQGAQAQHRLVEAMKHAFALRLRLGDPGSTCPPSSFMPLPPPAEPAGGEAQDQEAAPLGGTAGETSEPLPGRGGPDYADDSSISDVQPLDDPGSAPNWPATLPEDSQAAEQQDALAGQATAGEAGLPEGWDSDQFQQPFTPAEPDAVTNAPTFGGSPFDPAALYGAADALRAGQYGEPEQPSALDQTLAEGEGAGVDELQGSQEGEEAEDLSWGRRRRLRQFFGGLPGFDSKPPTDPFLEGEDQPEDGCFLNLQALLQDMVSPQFAAELRALIKDDLHKEGRVQYGGRWAPPAGTGEEAHDGGTSHIAVVDGKGMAVSLTSTINLGFGSLLMSPSTGIILNNQMDDFSVQGRYNAYGLRAAKANYIAAGKKPLSSMSPIMVEDRAGALRLVTGGSGGPRIITALLQTIFRLVVLGEDPLTAVAAPRLHHQLYPPSVSAENWTAGSMPFRTPPSLVQELRDRGHVVNGTAWGAVVQAIVRDPYSGMLTGVSDPRKDGAPSGF